MDAISWKIVNILRENARISFADLGKAVYLSAPAVADRVKKLEEAGIITGYKASLNLERLGYPIKALVQVKVFAGKEAEFVRAAKSRQEVLQCDNVTGEKSFMLKVTVPTMSQLDAMLEDFAALSETNSMIILSSAVDDRIDLQPIL